MKLNSLQKHIIKIAVLQPGKCNLVSTLYFFNKEFRKDLKELVEGKYIKIKWLKLYPDILAVMNYTGDNPTEIDKQLDMTENDYLYLSIIFNPR